MSDKNVTLREYFESAEVQDGKVWHIADAPGFDGTLCGIADEGIGHTAEKVYKEKMGSLKDVECQQCILTVKFCKSLK